MKHRKRGKQEEGWKNGTKQNLSEKNIGLFDENKGYYRFLNKIRFYRFFIIFYKIIVIKGFKGLFLPLDW